MNLLLYEIYWYGLWWLIFGAIAFAGARYFGVRGAVCGVITLAVLIYILDAMWVTADMKEHPEHERDMDFIFVLGVLLRIIFFNLLLLPVTILALWLRARSRRVKDAPSK